MSQPPSRLGLIPVLGVLLLIVTGLLYVTFMTISVPETSPDSNLSLIQADSSDPFITRVPSVPALSRPVLLADTPARGNLDATVQITVFSDFACPYCKEMAETLKRAVAQHQNVAVYWKDFPITSVHRDAEVAHIAARCADEQGKFWEYHDALFAAGPPFTRESVLKIAQDLRLRPQQFAECLSSEGPRSKIQQDTGEGNSLQIDATPYLFIGDQRVSGLMSPDELEQAIQIHAAINE